MKKDNRDKRTYKGNKNIADVLNNVLNTIAPEEGRIIYRIIKSWYEIVGQSISELTSPVKISFAGKATNGTLYVEVSNPGFALHIQSMENQIIQKICIYLGYDAISKIRTIVSKKKLEIQKSKETVRKRVTISDNDHNKIKQELSNIKDQELKLQLEQMAENLFEN